MMKFTREAGHSEKDLLQYGIDHIKTSIYLLENNGPDCYDSAGYIAQLGLGLIIKAWHLFVFDCFYDEHSLKKLYKKIIQKHPSKKIPKKHFETLSLLDRFYELRYPIPEKEPIEIGQDDSVKIKELVLSILKKMPRKSFQNFISGMEISTKGNRILMEKPIKK